MVGCCKNAMVQFLQQLGCLGQESIVTLSWQSEHSENYNKVFDPPSV